MFNLALFLALSFAFLQYASSVCNVCNSNGVACINEKDFHPCMDGKADSSMVFSCLHNNETCTKNAPVCMNKTLNTTIPACGDTSNCGKCINGTDNGKFTCTSRTTFTMCFDGTLTNIRDTCPGNKICDVDLAKQGQYPCVPSCNELKTNLCDLYVAIDAPVTTTTTEAPTTTTQAINNNGTVTVGSVMTTTVQQVISATPYTTTTQQPSDEFCARQTVVGRYLYPNDTTCKRYVYCFSRDGAMQTSLLKCPGTSYFNSATSLCEPDKPVGCT